MQNLLKHLFLPWSSGEKLIDVTSLSESAWRLHMLEDEFTVHISDSSCLYLRQGPYCPSDVTLPPQSVP